MNHTDYSHLLGELGPNDQSSSESEIDINNDESITGFVKAFTILKKNGEINDENSVEILNIFKSLVSDKINDDWLQKFDNALSANEESTQLSAKKTTQS